MFEPKDFSSLFSSFEQYEHATTILGDTSLENIADNIEPEYYSDLKKLDKDISSSVDILKSSNDNLNDSIANLIFDDFYEKTNIFTLLLRNNINEEVFPFDSWMNKQFNKAIQQENFYIFLEEISRINLDCFKENIPYFFTASLNNNFDIINILPKISNLIEKTIPNVDFNSLISSTNINEFSNTLNGETLKPTEKSSLFLNHHANFNSSKISPKELFIEFSNSEAWKTIKSENLVPCFLEAMIKNKEKNCFVVINKNYKYVSDIKKEVIFDFTDIVLKADIENTEKFSYLISKLGNGFASKYADFFSTMLKTSLAHQLNSDLYSNNQTKVKTKI